MAAPLINLVSTRCTDGNHLALRRWYADHVHLLLGAPELQQAWLYRCGKTLSGEPPDYFCMYEFASLQAFEAFEHGEPKAQATLLTNAAAGRSSIEIVQRVQYARQIHRQWASTVASSKAWRLAASFLCEDGWSLEKERWLADHLEALRACTPLVAAQAYVSPAQPTKGFIALDFVGGDASDVWQLLQDQFSQVSLYGQSPESLRFEWAAMAQWQQTWLR
jgi:hypothetical protein